MRTARSPGQSPEKPSEVLCRRPIQTTPQALPEPPASPPAILAAGGLELPSLAGTAGAHVNGQILLGVMVTAVAAYLFVRFLLRSFQTRALTPFAIYCLALGHSASSASPYDPGQAPDRDRGSGGRAGHEGGRHGFARIHGGPRPPAPASAGGPAGAPRRGAAPLPGAVNEQQAKARAAAGISFPGCLAVAMTSRGAGSGLTSGRYWRTAGGGPRPRRRDRTQKHVSAAAPSAATASVVASPLRGSCSS